MKRITLFLTAALIAAGPALADDNRPATDDFRDGAQKFGEALDHFFDGLSKEMEPMAEAWHDLLEDLGDLNQYEAPEKLPNGDILIRRKTPLPGTDI